MDLNHVWQSVNGEPRKRVLIGVMPQCQAELVLVPALSKRLLELPRREVAKEANGADKLI
jgi:hypothetical protein